MQLSHHQKEIIELIKEEGYTLKFQQSFSTSWWLVKEVKKGHISSINILKSTAKKLLSLKLIELEKIDKYEHHIYKLTDKKIN